MRSRNPRDSTFNFSRKSEPDALRQDIVIAVCDFLQQAAVDFHQDPQRGPAIFIDEFHQPLCRFVVFARAISFIFQSRPQLLHLRRVLQRAGSKIGSRKVAAHKVFCGNINASHGRIFFYVADDIGQLKCQPAVFRQKFRFGILIAKNLDTHQSHNRSYVIAILLQVFKSFAQNGRRFC